MRNTTNVVQTAKMKMPVPSASSPAAAPNATVAMMKVVKPTQKSIDRATARRPTEAESRSVDARSLPGVAAATSAYCRVGRVDEMMFSSTEQRAQDRQICRALRLRDV